MLAAWSIPCSNSSKLSYSELSLPPPPSSPPPSRIVAEDSLVRRRRHLLDATNHTTITLEFGNPPDVNISQPDPPTVANEIAMAGEVNDSVDIEVCLSVCLSVCLFSQRISI